MVMMQANTPESDMLLLGESDDRAAYDRGWVAPSGRPGYLSPGKFNRAAHLDGMAGVAEQIDRANRDRRRIYQLNPMSARSHTAYSSSSVGLRRSSLRSV